MDNPRLWINVKLTTCIDITIFNQEEIYLHHGTHIIKYYVELLLL